MVTALLLSLLALNPCEAADAVRIQRHLFDTAVDLRAHPPPGLTAAQSAARERNLERLHAYAARGQFPKNVDFAERTPYFIDGSGTRCAMAQLIEEAEGADFVARVARERNNATVWELSDEPALHEWLEMNGLTVAEAARIQPTYEYCAALRAVAMCIGDPRAGGIFRVDSHDGGAGFLVLETAFSDAGTRDGGLFFTVGDFDSHYAVGTRVFARQDDNGEFGPFAVLSTDGVLSLPHDRRCARKPTLPLATLLSTSDGGSTFDYAHCRSVLAAHDSEWTRPFCASGWGAWWSTGNLETCDFDGGFGAEHEQQSMDGTWLLWTARPPPTVSAPSGVGVRSDRASGDLPAATGCSVAGGSVAVLALALIARRRR